MSDARSFLDALNRDYVALHTCVDAKSMQVKWQVAVRGNLDLCATDYEGLYSMGTCYNSEGGMVLADMMGNDRDWLVVFNIAEIEKAVAAGNTFTIGDSDVPVVDGRGEKNPYALYIPIPNSPHGINTAPDGRHVMIAGKRAWNDAQTRWGRDTMGFGLYACRQG